MFNSGRLLSACFGDKLFTLLMAECTRLPTCRAPACGLPGLSMKSRILPYTPARVSRPQMPPRRFVHRGTYRCTWFDFRPDTGKSSIRHISVRSAFTSLFNLDSWTDIADMSAVNQEQAIDMSKKHLNNHYSTSTHLSQVQRNFEPKTYSS